MTFGESISSRCPIESLTNQARYYGTGITEQVLRNRYYGTGITEQVLRNRYLAPVLASTGAGLRASHGPFGATRCVRPEWGGPRTRAIDPPPAGRKRRPQTAGPLFPHSARPPRRVQARSPSPVLARTCPLLVFVAWSCLSSCVLIFISVYFFVFVCGW